MKSRLCEIGRAQRGRIVVTCSPNRDLQPASARHVPSSLQPASRRLSHSPPSGHSYAMSPRGLAVSPPYTPGGRRHSSWQAPLLPIRNGSLLHGSLLPSRMEAEAFRTHLPPAALPCASFHESPIAQGVDHIDIINVDCVINTFAVNVNQFPPGCPLLAT